jgi:hypothetical protein
VKVHFLARLYVPATEITLAAGAAAAERPVAVLEATSSLLIPSEDRRLVGEMGDQVLALRLTEATPADFLTVSLHHTMISAEEPHTVLTEPRRRPTTDK